MRVAWSHKGYEAMRAVRASKGVEAIGVARVSADTGLLGGEGYSGH